MFDSKMINELKEKLLNVYSIDTVNDQYKKNWSNNDPTYGQCAVTALLVQELYGGEIYKLELENHYYNLVNGQIIDLTKEQFTYDLDYSKGVKRIKPFDEETIDRFNKLKQSLNCLK